MTHAPRDRPATSHDVARLAGVSRGTVSMVMNGRDTAFSDATRLRVRDAAQALNYRPQVAGRMLARGRTESIGVAVCHRDLLASDGFVPILLQAMTTEARAHGYRIVLDVVDADTDESFSDLMEARQIDGVLVVDPRQGDTRLQQLLDTGAPLVLLGSTGHPAECTVNLRTDAAMVALVDHLVELGHERFAMITPTPEGFGSASNRLRAARAALERHGLSLDPSSVGYGKFDAGSGRDAALTILASRNRPTAILGGNDTVALGILDAARAMGLSVPHDLAVTGFDNLPWSSFVEPALTTVDTFAAQQGRLASRTLIDRVRDPTGSALQRSFVDGVLIVRRSTTA